MKYFLTYLCFLMILPLSAEPKAELAKEAQQDSVEYLSKQTFTLLMSPFELTLSIEDEKSLDQALNQLKVKSERIKEIAKELQKREIPQPEQRKAFDEYFTQNELALRKRIGKEYKKQLAEMPAEQSQKWKAAMKDFMTSFSQQKAIFETYFSAKDPIREQDGTE